jgi:hypothetical protein
MYVKRHTLEVNISAADHNHIDSSQCTLIIDMAGKSTILALFTWAMTLLLIFMTAHGTYVNSLFAHVVCSLDR